MSTRQPRNVSCLLPALVLMVKNTTAENVYPDDYSKRKTSKARKMAKSLKHHLFLARTTCAYYCQQAERQGNNEKERRGVVKAKQTSNQGKG